RPHQRRSAGLLKRVGPASRGHIASAKISRPRGVRNVPEYLISQHDTRGERSEQMAAVKKVHTYNMQYGFPVAAGPDDGNGPSAHWQLKAIEEQERIRLNLLALRRKGRWDFVNEL